jgi:hypothetical protein
MPRLPLFDGVGLPNIPNPSLPETLIPNETHSTCLGVPLFFLSSIPHQSFLLPAYPTHVPSRLQKIPTYRHKSQTSTLDSISYFKGPQNSLSFRIITSSLKVLFGGRGMD